MERKIGEIFEHNGEWYQCIVGNDCENCAFNEKKCYTIVDNGDPIGDCCDDRRKDNKNVIFKKLERVGEPYPNADKLYQLYRLPMNIEKLPPHTEGINLVRFDIVEIEIKQNKEDMEEKKQNVYIVYKHISPTRKEYVGMTRNIKKRWEGNGCSYTKNSEFRNDIMKYGWDNFQHIIIKDRLSLSEASKLEDELIVDAMNRGVAYNIARGGIGGSHPAWNKGIPLSEEQKAKLTAANKGKKLSDETKRKIGDAGRGRVVSDETRRKIGDKNRGKKHSKKHMKKWIESNRWRFCKIEIKKDGATIGVYESKREAARATGLSRGFINGVIKRPNGKHQGYTIIILD